MNKKYHKFNIICLSLSLVFWSAIVWLWVNVQAADKYEITKYELQPEVNKNQLADSNKQVTNNNEKIEQLDNTTSTPSSPSQKSESLPLPQKYLLNVPFTSQAPEKNWEQPWQDACEEAALLMLDAYHKGYGLSPIMARDEIFRMVEWETARGWGYDIDSEQLKIMAKEYFKINLKIVENPTIRQIKEFVVSKKPVYIVASGKDLANPHFKNGGPIYHTLVVVGYNENEFITNDPGTQFGESFKYKYDGLMNAIRDWNNGDVKNGRKVILVVE